VDQKKKLTQLGVAQERIRLKPNPSPAAFGPEVGPISLPKELHGQSGIILYSGNWGVPHDEDTFVDAYAEYRRQSKRGLALWLNAIGAKADRVESAIRTRRAPIHRSRLVSLRDLPRLLTAADVHLITLRDEFVGYVVPSKIHACIASGKRLLFVGSADSEVHRLASDALPPARYHRVDVGDVDGLVGALLTFERAVSHESMLEMVN
jgi:hypothetical protein